MGGTASSRAMLGNRRHDVWAQRVLAAPSIATSSERRGVHRLKDVAKRLLNLLCKSTTLTAYSRAQCRQSLHRTGCEKAMLSTFSTECRTRLPCFWYFFKKVQKERLEENISEQSRLRAAVEYKYRRRNVHTEFLLNLIAMRKENRTAWRYRRECRSSSLPTRQFYNCWKVARWRWRILFLTCEI